MKRSHLKTGCFPPVTSATSPFTFGAVKMSTPVFLFQEPVEAHLVRRSITWINEGFFSFKTR